jgi:hypothetical protein
MVLIKPKHIVAIPAGMATGMVRDSKAGWWHLGERTGEQILLDPAAEMHIVIPLLVRLAELLVKACDIGCYFLRALVATLQDHLAPHDLTNTRVISSRRALVA